MPELPRPREAAFLPLELKSVAPDGIFEGYASLFDRADLGNDVVRPGAFRDTLRARGAAGIRMLFQHDAAQPIGVWERISEDAQGLFVRGRLLADVARAREVLALMRAGAIDGLSIGFKAVQARRDRARGLRHIEKIDLWEISIVTFPMLPGARIATVDRRSSAHRSALAAPAARASRARVDSSLPRFGAARPSAGDVTEEARIAAKLATLATYLRST